MLAETHKIVAKEVHSHLLMQYGVELNKKELLRGSVAPDFLPHLKAIRHYKEESIGYISKEILKLIILVMNTDFSKPSDSFKIRKISRKLGIISHYLADYMTHPHARRITCITKESALEHFRYERSLNGVAKNYEFSYDLKENWEPVDLNHSLFFSRFSIADGIEAVIEEYLEQPINYETDLDYAINLNLFIAEVVFEAAFAFSGQKELQLV